MAKTDYFWTDTTQARERLQGSVVVYDGRPVYVAEIVDHDSEPKAIIINCDDPGQTRTRKLLSSPKFKKFRELPKQGFVNMENKVGLCIVRRRVTSTRVHGLFESNTSVDWVNIDEDKGVVFGRGGSFGNGIWTDPGFTNAHLGNYPTMESIIRSLKPGTGCAYNNQYAVIRDHAGYRCLYRLDQRVGIIVDANTLLLTEKTRFLREELQSDPTFTLNAIREF
jgi:hypothetical protein